MAPPDQGGGASPRSPVLRRQMSCTSSHSRDEQVQLERRLSCSSASFPSSSPGASPAPSSTSTSYHGGESCESIPYADPDLLGKPSSFSSSTSFYESFHVDPDNDSSKYLDFEPPPTRAPAVQAMAAAAMQMKAAECCTVGYDPKRLPSSMFRTRSTNPAEWSVTSNESLFSIRLSTSSDLGDLYYDAAGFPRFPSMGSATSLRLSPSFVSEGTGGLCLMGDCARCSSGGATRKSVRFATAESVSGGSHHSALSPANANAQEPPTASTAMTPETAARWCQFGCYWPSLPTTWWPRCCAWHCHCCDHRRC